MRLAKYGLFWTLSALALTVAMLLGVSLSVLPAYIFFGGH